MARLGAQLAAGLADAARDGRRPAAGQRVRLDADAVLHAPSRCATIQSALTADTQAYGRFFHAMLARGVYPPPSQFEAWFLSGAHTDRDIDATIKAARRAFEAGLTPATVISGGVSIRTRRIVPGGSVDVLSFGRHHRAAAADQDADQRAFHAADDAADDRADRRAGADPCRPRP